MIELSIKKEKDSTRTLSLVIHSVRLIKNLQKSTLAFNKGWNAKKPSVLVVNWISSCLSFFLSASTAATYIFTSLNYTTPIISLGPRALNAEFQHFILSCNISYWDLIRYLYFADITERGDRGWKEAQRQGEDRVNLLITLMNSFLWW